MTPRHATRTTTTTDRVRLARILARVAAACLVVTTIATVGLSLALRPATPAPAGWTVVTVGENATLWDLARAHPVPGADTAEAVEIIRERNGLAGGALLAGQQLEVPVQGGIAALAQR